MRVWDADPARKYLTVAARVLEYLQVQADGKKQPLLGRFLSSRFSRSHRSLDFRLHF